MALVRWNPFGELDSYFDSLNKWPVSDGAWSPRVDILENDDNIVISAEVAGVDKKDIDITLEKGILSISGERKLEDEDRKDNYHRMERYYGSFHRHFHLSDTLDGDKVEASMDNGILKVTVQKKPEVKPKQISISVN